MRVPSSFLLAVAIATCGTLSVHAQNLILNGDFTANASSYTSSPGYDTGGSNPANPTDWTVTAGAGGHGAGGLNGADTGSGNIFGPNSLTINTGGSVRDFAFLQSSPDLSQTFNVVAGQTYALTYDAASRNQDTSNNAVMVTTVTDNDPASTVLFEQSGALADDQFYANTTPGLLVDTVGVGDTFTADVTGQVTLTFAPLSSAAFPASDHASDVADVSVEAVPEPSSLTLCLGGAGLILLLHGRRILRVS